MTTKINPNKTDKTETKKQHDAKTYVAGNDEAKYEVALPEGFDFNEHKLLRRKNFTRDDLYFEHRALHLDHKAGKFRGMAAEAKALGSREDRARAKKLQRMNDQMAELREQLEKSGVDVGALLKIK